MQRAEQTEIRKKYRVEHLPPSHKVHRQYEEDSQTHSNHHPEEQYAPKSWLVLSTTPKSV
jgi:hypothetical protein